MLILGLICIFGIHGCCSTKSAKVYGPVPAPRLHPGTLSNVINNINNPVTSGQHAFNPIYIPAAHQALSGRNQPLLGTASLSTPPVNNNQNDLALLNSLLQNDISLARTFPAAISNGGPLQSTGGQTPTNTGVISGRSAGTSLPGFSGLNSRNAPSLNLGGTPSLINPALHPAAALGNARSLPHPETILHNVVGSGSVPHPATVLRNAVLTRSVPHPATILHNAVGSGSVPHPATVLRNAVSRGSVPHPASVLRNAVGLGSVPHPAAALGSAVGSGSIVSHPGSVLQAVASSARRRQPGLHPAALLHRLSQQRGPVHPGALLQHIAPRTHHLPLVNRGNLGPNSILHNIASRNHHTALSNRLLSRFVHPGPTIRYFPHHSSVGRSAVGPVTSSGMESNTIIRTNGPNLPTVLHVGRRTQSASVRGMQSSSGRSLPGNGKFYPKRRKTSISDVLNNLGSLGQQQFESLGRSRTAPRPRGFAVPGSAGDGMFDADSNFGTLGQPQFENLRRSLAAPSPTGFAVPGSVGDGIVDAADFAVGNGIPGDDLDDVRDTFNDDLDDVTDTFNDDFDDFGERFNDEFEDGEENNDDNGDNDDADPFDDNGRDDLNDDLDSFDNNFDDERPFVSPGGFSARRPPLPSGISIPAPNRENFDNANNGVPFAIPSFSRRPPLPTGISIPGTNLENNQPTFTGSSVQSPNQLPNIANIPSIAQLPRDSFRPCCSRGVTINVNINRDLETDNPVSINGRPPLPSGVSMPGQITGNNQQPRFAGGLLGTPRRAESPNLSFNVPSPNDNTDNQILNNGRPPLPSGFSMPGQITGNNQQPRFAGGLLGTPRRAESPNLSFNVPSPRDNTDNQMPNNGRPPLPSGFSMPGQITGNNQPRFDDGLLGTPRREAFQDPSLNVPSTDADPLSSMLQRMRAMQPRLRTVATPVRTRRLRKPRKGFKSQYSSPFNGRRSFLSSSRRGRGILKRKTKYNAAPPYYRPRYRTHRRRRPPFYRNKFSGSSKNRRFLRRPFRQRSRILGSPNYSRRPHTNTFGKYS